MATYLYQSRNQAGQIQTGTVEAASREGAVETLQQHGLTVISVIASGEVNILERVFTISRVSTKDIVIFSRQLATMINARLPLLDSLRILVRQTEKRVMMGVIFDIANKVEGGTKLSAALAAHPKVFSKFYVGLVRSGEKSGKLDEILAYLAEQLEKNYDLQGKIRGALLYPIFVISAMVVVGALMMIIVVPTLVGVLEGADVVLPLSTIILMAVSKFVVNWWLLVLIVIIAAVVALVLWTRTPQGRYVWDGWTLRVPFFGSLLQRIYMVRFAQNLNTLVVGDLPIVQSLRVVADVVGNTRYAEILNETADKVKGGYTIASVLEKNPLVPPMVGSMIAVGERTGRLDDILAAIARFYAREVDNIVTAITRVLEPVLIVIIGIGVAVLVSAILLPIYSLVGAF